MRGRKPNLKNVIPMHGDGVVDAEAVREEAVRRQVRRLMPRGMGPELRREWRRVAAMLAAPTLDRLKPHYVDTIYEYCVVVLRIRAIRRSIELLAEQATKASGRDVAAIDAETYRIKGRNGDQAKTLPQVAQLNEAWRQWHSLVGDLGLSPSAERNMLPGQGDLFDESEREFA